MLKGMTDACIAQGAACAHPVGHSGPSNAGTSGKWGRRFGARYKTAASAPFPPCCRVPKRRAFGPGTAKPRLSQGERCQSRGQDASMVGADTIIGVDVNIGKEEWRRRFGTTHRQSEKVSGDIVHHLVALTDGAPSIAPATPRWCTRSWKRATASRPDLRQCETTRSAPSAMAHRTQIAVPLTMLRRNRLR
jgi:hypothetical protein